MTDQPYVCNYSDRCKVDCPFKHDVRKTPIREYGKIYDLCPHKNIEGIGINTEEQMNYYEGLEYHDCKECQYYFLLSKDEKFGIIRAYCSEFKIMLDENTPKMSCGRYMELQEGLTDNDRRLIQRFKDNDARLQFLLPHLKEYMENNGYTITKTSRREDERTLSGL